LALHLSGRERKDQRISLEIIFTKKMFKISILVVAFLLIGNAKTWAKNLAPNFEDHQEVQEGNYTQTCDNSLLPIVTPIYFFYL
jgi:hypothetical protein